MAEYVCSYEPFSHFSGVKRQRKTGIETARRAATGHPGSQLAAKVAADEGRRHAAQPRGEMGTTGVPQLRNRTGLQHGRGLRRFLPTATKRRRLKSHAYTSFTLKKIIIKK